jgi:arylsulfatase A-like enzyme
MLCDPRSGVMRTALLAVLLAGAFAGVAAPQAVAPRAVRHVVVVLLDDVGVDKVGAYGEHPTAGPTPVVDALAAEGVLFRAAYAEPECSPTRAAILTGLHPSRTGVGTIIPLGNAAGSLAGTFVASEDLDWLPRRLTACGIVCEAVGKWHLTHELVPDFHRHPIRVGFRRHAGHLGNLGSWKSLPEDEGYWSWEKNVATASGWSQTTSTMYATLDTAYEAYIALTTAASLHRRSFTWLALNAAHDPWDKPPRDLFTGNFEGAAGQEESVLESADTLLGQLLAAWTAAAPTEAAATVWIVMGDNGTPSEAVEPPWPAIQSKSHVTEGGIRVPLIVAGPGVVHGAECSAPVHAPDVWATVLELMGTPPPTTGTDAISFVPALRDPAAFKGRGWAYARIHTPNGFGPYTYNRRAVRRADGWKLRVQDAFPASTEYHLNNVLSDPLEQVEFYPPTTSETTAIFNELLAIVQQCDAPTAP